MERLWSDLRYAARSLSRSPVASVAAVLCLGLGIGANTTMFGVVDRLLFRPPPYVRDAGRVMRVLYQRTYRGEGPTTGMIGAFPSYLDLADGAGVFDGVAAFHTTRADLGRGREAQRVTVRIVTHTFFPVLGVQAALGRFFGPDDDRVGATPVAVLDYDFWLSHFAGDRSELGKTLLIGQVVYTVIGVAPRGFAGVDQSPPDLWLPASIAGPQLVFANALDSRGSFWVSAIARLKPGVTPAAAATAATIPARRGTAEGQAFSPPPTVVLAPILEGRGPDPGLNVQVAVWVAWVAAIVLLIACANVTNLLLTRAATRQREIAIRVAIGSGRGRLIRQQMLEALVLAGAGAVVAVLLAWWGGSLVRALILPRVPGFDAVFDVRVLAFTALVAVATGLACGVIPALQASRPDLTKALKAGRHAGELRHGATRDTLLVLQVALTVVLLTGAGLFIRSLANVRGLSYGFDADHVLLATVDLQRAGYDTSRTAAFYEEAQRRVRLVPGVRTVALSAMPFGWGSGMSVRVPGVDSFPHPSFGGPYIDAVSPEYFDAVGRPILRGRAFTAADQAGSAPVMIVGATLARWYWRGENPVGKCAYLGNSRSCSEVVGVAADTRRQVRDDDNMMVYMPLAQGASWHYFARAIEIGTAMPASSMIGPVRRALQQAAPDLPFVQISGIPDLLEPQYVSWRLGATMFGVCGALALLVATVGLYAVLAYMVAQRTHEVGIRMSLGATARDVLGLIVGRGVRVTAIGLVIGGGVALVGGRTLASVLYGVTPRDPAVLAVATMSLLLAALAASYLPARRATRVDPAVALREE